MIFPADIFFFAFFGLLLPAAIYYLDYYFVFKDESMFHLLMYINVKNAQRVCVTLNTLWWKYSFEYLFGQQLTNAGQFRLSQRFMSALCVHHLVLIPGQVEIRQSTFLLSNKKEKNPSKKNLTRFVHTWRFCSFNQFTL